AGQTFVVSATDQTSGETATAEFTDTPPASTTQDVGVLAAPTGASPTGTDYNNTHWAVLDGDTIHGTILNATDALTASGNKPVDGDIVWVEIKSTQHGNTYVEGTYHQDNSITFTWTVESPNGSDICDTTIVAYETTGGFNGSDNSGLFTNTSNDLTNDGLLNGNGNSSAGFAIVNSDGSDHECTDDTISISGTKYTDVNGKDANTSLGVDDTAGTPGQTFTINLYDWHDTGDNVVQAGELTLLDTTETDETTGAWSFTDLGPLASGDKYYVKEVGETGWTQTFGKDGYVITPTSGTDSTTNNFANFENFDISGTKYTDVNGKDANTSLGVDDTV